MNTSRTRTWLMAAAVGALLAPAPAVLAAAASERLIPPAEMDGMLPVRNVRLEHGAVTGEVVNMTDHPMHDVRLDIDYDWLWAHEFRPGTDRYSRLVSFRLPGDIPPHGSREFSYNPDSPPRARRDGRYLAIVHVARATEIGG